MGEHTTLLAFESPLLLSIMALLSAGVWLLLWTRTRAGYMLPQALGWGLLCVYWGLLAISAGPAPALERADIALYVRVTGVTAAVALLAGKAALLWRWRKAGKCCRGE